MRVATSLLDAHCPQGRLARMRIGLVWAKTVLFAGLFSRGQSRSERMLPDGESFRVFHASNSLRDFTPMNVA